MAIPNIEVSAKCAKQNRHHLSPPLTCCDEYCAQQDIYRRPRANEGAEEVQKHEHFRTRRRVPKAWFG
jgi:hypothetical protein